MATCLRLVAQFGLDGLKIDFLDEAIAYAGTPSNGDIADVGEAMRVMLTELRAALTEAGIEDTLIEFRQSYVGPATAAFGNVLRANDCPADAAINRRSIADVRLLATTQVVHSDPIMWDHRAGPEVAIRQLFNGFFAVPQVSMRLHELPEAQLRAVGWALSEWTRSRDAIIYGIFDAGLPSQGVPYLCVNDGINAVLGIYQAHVVELPSALHVTILNGSTQDQVVIRSETQQQMKVLVHRPDHDSVDKIMELTLVEGINELPIKAGCIMELHHLD